MDTTEYFHHLELHEEAVLELNSTVRACGSAAIEMAFYAQGEEANGSPVQGLRWNQEH